MSDTTKVTCAKLLAILFVILLLVVIPFIQWPHQYIAWVGGTDLEIEFVVTDATTNAGILGAKIAVLEGPSTFCRPSGPFDIFTDADGKARRLCKDCMCFGTQGPGVNTFVVHLPSWVIRFSASGYVTSDFFYLDDVEHARRAKRGKEHATLSVPIQLTRIKKAEH